MPTALETQTERGLGNYCITVRVFIVMWCLIKKQKQIYIYNYYIMIPRPDLDLYATNSKVTAQLYSKCTAEYNSNDYIVSFHPF